VHAAISEQAARLKRIRRHAHPGGTFPGFALAAVAWTAAVALSATQETARDAGWRSDLRFLVAEAQRVHAGPARPAHSRPFLTAAARLADWIPVLSDRRIVVGVQRLPVMLGDGHSLVYPIPSARAPFAMLPIDVYLFADGFVVTDAPAGVRELIGGRITHIGGRPIDRLLHDLEPFVSRDNAMGDQGVCRTLPHRTGLSRSAGRRARP